MRTYAGAPRAWHGPFGLPPLWSKPALPSPFAMSVILPYIAPLLLLLETNTEAKVVEAVARGTGVALSRTQARPAVAPGTTPLDPIRALSRSARIRHRVAGGISHLVPVRSPFPDISVHIKKAPWVGGKLSDIHRLVRVRTMVPVCIRTGNCVTP